MSDERSAAPIRIWSADPPPRDVRKQLERLARADDVQHVAVMPDVHLAEGVCVGVVLATRELLYPQAVGSDIGCGMATVSFQGSAEAVLDREDRLDQLLERLRFAVPVIRHREPQDLPDPLSPERLSDPSLAAVARRDGRVQLGTLGRGNHFLELQSDAEDRLWLMVHSGSRAMGPLISRHHRRQARSTSAGLASIRADSDAGAAFLEDARWALEYARLGRVLMLQAGGRLVRQLLRLEPDPSTFVECTHNLVRRERHHGEAWWVHRKGAMSAAEGEAGIIPGSMASPSYHVVGRGEPAALASSSHGAGRRLSRSEARQRISRQRLVREMRGVWFDQAAARRLVDEAPSAYKDIGAVMRAQRKLVRIVRIVQPRLSYKGS